MNGFAKAVAGAIVLLLTALLFYAFAIGDVVGDQLHVWERIWGIYVWADAYSGFLLFSTLVYAFERRLGFTVAMFVLTCCTGNMINAAWLLWRGPEFYRRIKGSNQA